MSDIFYNSADGIPVAGLASGTDGELITWDSSGNPTTVGPGTSGQVFTSNGAGQPGSFQDAASSLSTPNVISTVMESETRITETLTGSATATIDSLGYDLRVTTSAGDAARIDFRTQNGIGPSIFSASSAMGTQFGRIASSINNAEIGNWIGPMTITGTAITRTTKHYGAIMEVTAGTNDYQATVADGTTETNTSVGAVFNPQNILTYIKNGSVDVKFYRGQTLDATITTNLPSGSMTGTGAIFSAGMNNKNTADDGDVTISYWGFSYDPT